MRPKLSDTIITGGSPEKFLCYYFWLNWLDSQDPFGSREAIKSSLQDDPLLVRDIIN